MRVDRIRLANVRAIESAEFEFSPGFNVLVGVNGVGKTTVLEALSVVLSSVVRETNGLRDRAAAFNAHDIRSSSSALTVECSVSIGGTSYEYLVHKGRSLAEGRSSRTGEPRQQSLDTPDRSEFVGTPPNGPQLSKEGVHPLGVFFSTRRATALSSGQTGSTAGGAAAAFADAFGHRELRLAEFALWMRAQEALKADLPRAERVLRTFRSVVSRFLPDYEGIRVSAENPPALMIERGGRTAVPVEDLSDSGRAAVEAALEWADQWMSLNWKPDSSLSDAELEEALKVARQNVLDEALAQRAPGLANLRQHEGISSLVVDVEPTAINAEQLSDGERGLLALVLDLTRRLSQMNPELDEPTSEAEAVVLIDEIELHLHPGWQRQTVSNLTAAFPRCQFIVTTHSPQVIGEVEHERIQVIADGQVHSPARSLGVDSSSLLEEVMGAPSRTEEVSALLSGISAQIGQQRFAKAREALGKLSGHLGTDDPEVTRLSTLLDFLEGEE